MDARLSVGISPLSIFNPLRIDIRQIIDILHISYSYHGDYPKDSVDEEFERWRDLVEQFVDDLEQASSGSYSWLCKSAKANETNGTAALVSIQRFH